MKENISDAPLVISEKNLRRITVSNAFFRFVKEEFPQLQRHSGFLEFFFYLNFGANFDYDTKRLLLPSDLISKMEGRSETNRHAEDFLRRFQTFVIPHGGRFKWSEPDFHAGKCRQLIALHWGPHQHIIESELKNEWRNMGRVYLDEVEFSKPKGLERTRNLQVIDQREAEAQEPYCKAAREIQEYLHDLPPNTFTTTVEKNIREARSIASKAQTEQSRQYQHRLLTLIETQPKPLYFATDEGNTVRLFTSNSIANLPGDTRKTLTAGCIDADLRSSQLAICAKQWKIESISKLLAEKRSFWTYILDYLEIKSDCQAYKDEIKESLYSACFGMTRESIKKNLRKRLSNAGLDVTIVEKFARNPLIRDLLKARALALRKIKAGGGAFTIFGKWCEVDEERSPRQILAEMAQAIELSLIYPAFELAKTTDEFKIMLFQHDGFSVHFTRRPKLWKRRIEAAVQAKIDQGGYNTELEWSA